ncbi:hypothetical protein GCM10022409_12590 [Hymenobacter glaciei]|uniref:Carboxypeptidase-like regulatory domain-containing protein n=1 Tax=Hymenobacter glaciei TaxID=877209 RepID=A0ABP7TQZ8_9BACT
MAQTTVLGRVLDAKTGYDLPGATVLQTGTTNGVSTDVEGNFTLSITAVADSLSITASFIGYVEQRQRVPAGNYIIIRLVPQAPSVDCPVIGRDPLVELGLVSGMRYAPVGGTVKFYGTRLYHRLHLTATIGYQTNFSRNHAFTASLGLPALWQQRFTVAEVLSYEQLQAMPANMRFSSYKMMVSIGSFRSIAPLSRLMFLLGGGYAQHQPLAPSDVLSASTAGLGYSFGLQTNYYFQPFRLAGVVQATHWPSYWQWQARLTHPFGDSFQAGVAVNQLRHYSELTLFLSRAFY